MRGRHVTTGVTLLILLGILVVGLLYGMNALFRPLPDDKSAQPTCRTTSVSKGERIRARQVLVNVYNAGSRAGLADETLQAFKNRGFRAGNADNAPENAKIVRAQVWTTHRNDASARLVARQLGAGIKVEVVKRDLGPGVDVLVGDKFSKLVKAKKVVVVRKSTTACLKQRSTSS